MRSDATAPDRDGWVRLPLDECMVAIIDYRGKSPTKADRGVPLITAKIVKGGRIAPPEEFIDPAEYDAWMRRGLPMAGDVLVTTEAPLGEVAQLDGRKVALAQRLIALRANPEILHHRYLCFLMQSLSVQEQLRSRATGTTVLGIRQSELRKVLLEFPPLAQQRAIARILGALDDKIELNRRTNETLEAMARAIFQSWFIDFDPVCAKVEGRQPGGIDAETAKMFPSRMTSRALSPLPETWTLAPLTSIVELNPARPKQNEEHCAYVDMASLPTRGHRITEVTRRPQGSGARFKNGDTLFARITPCLENGKAAFVDVLSEGEVGWGSTEFIVLRPVEPVPLYFAYLLARSEPFRAHAIQSMSGTTGRQRVPSEALARFELATPPPELWRRFGLIVEPWVTAIKTLDEQSTTLRGLRDTLFPKLLSGELRVPEAEHAVESVL